MTSDVRERPDLRELLQASRARGQTVLAVGPVEQTESLAFVLGALRVVRPDVAPATPPARWPRPSDLALQRVLRDAGLRDMQWATAAWDLTVASAADLLDLVTDVPILATALERLTEAERGQLRQVLDGMLRERSGGTPGAVLRAEVRVATTTT